MIVQYAATMHSGHINEIDGIPLNSRFSASITIDETALMLLNPNRYFIEARI